VIKTGEPEIRLTENRLTEKSVRKNCELKTEPKLSVNRIFRVGKNMNRNRIGKLG